MNRLTFACMTMLLVLSSVAFAQDFTILGPNPTTRTIVCPTDHSVFDTIRVKNNTSTKLSLSYSFPTREAQIKVSPSIGTVPIPAQGTYNLIVEVNARNWYSMTFSRALTITGGSTTSVVNYNVDVRSYCVGYDLWQNIYWKDVPVGETRCEKLWAYNPTKEPIVISKGGFQGGGVNTPTMTATPLLPLPIVILPGEEFPAFQICYTPTAASQYSWQRFGIVCSPELQNGYDGVSDITGYSVKDPNLEKPCIVASVDTNLVGPVLFNGTVEKTITLTNNRYSEKVITSANMSMDVSNFAFVGNPFPLTLAPISSQTVTIAFTPNQVDPIVKYRYAADVIFNSSDVDSQQNDGCGAKITLVGLATLPTTPADVTPLFPDKEYFLGMTGKAPTFSQDFYFVNNGATNIKVTGIALTNPSSEFQITDIKPTVVLPFTLLPNDQMTVRVTFTPSKPGKVFFNNLMITTEAALQAITFPLQGMQTEATADVREEDKDIVTVSLSPNPTTDKVSLAVDGVRSFSYEILSVLGTRHLYNSEGTSRELDLRPLHLSAGPYFIRIVGYTQTGERYVTTRKFLVQ